MGRRKINKKIKAKNYGTLDPLDIGRESFRYRKTTVKQKKYNEIYRVLELFSINARGRLMECGNILLKHSLTLKKTRRPNIRVLQYDWILVLWWKQWERWVLFDRASYEAEMSRILRRFYPGEHLLVFLKRVRFLFDPETFVVKVVDARTKNYVLTNPVCLARTFEKKRKVSTLFEALDTLPDEVKASIEAKDFAARQKKRAWLKKELQKEEHREKQFDNLDLCIHPRT